MDGRFSQGTRLGHHLGRCPNKKNPHEVQAWRAAGHTTFFLKPGWTNYAFWIQAYKFVKCFPDIIAVAAKAKSGEMFFVSGSGKIN